MSRVLGLPRLWTGLPHQSSTSPDLTFRGVRAAVEQPRGGAEHHLADQILQVEVRRVAQQLVPVRRTPQQRPGVQYPSHTVTLSEVITIATEDDDS
jgi:hypothetical protein